MSNKFTVIKSNADTENINRNHEKQSDSRYYKT